MSQKFYSDIEVKAGLRDSSGSLGASGQILSSTSGNVSWVTPTVNTVARDVQNEVKAGVAINKGQAVYVTGADGTNIIVGLASNTSEATSSKTLGLLNATVAINGFADVVQIGRLAGLNTIGANAGDPVWLGTNGNLIYGLINKPYAPAHLVFLGIVTRVNANNGEIFVNVQNGFELKEIHDVDIITNVPINGDVLGYDGTLWVNKTIAEWLGYTPANANGTTNYVSKFTGATTLGDSQIFDNGTNVGIGTNAPNATLQVGNGAGVKAIYVTGSGNNLGLGGLSVSFLGFATGTISTVNTSGAVPLGVGTRSTQPLVLGTNNAERMRIDSSGNVGIGTNAPQAKLHSNSDILTGYFQNGTDGIYDALKITNNTASNNLSGNSARIQFYNNANNYTNLLGASIRSVNVDYGWASDLILSSVQNNGYASQTVNDAIYIKSNGNVGIGTSSPSVKLHVVGGGYMPVIFEGGTNAGAGLYFSGGGTQFAEIFGEYESSNNGQMFFRTRNAGSINTAMTIKSSGNVGIGTGSPNSRLEVREANRVFDGYGNINVFTTDTGTQNVGGSIALGGDSFGGTTPYPFAKIQGIKEGGGTWAGALVLGTTQANSAITEKMRITSSGNVGIGTTSPTKLLDVNGDALINGLTAGLGGGNIAGNTVVGYESLFFNSSGSGNTTIGYVAGRNITNGNRNIFIGAYTGSAATTAEYSTVIGGYLTPDKKDFNNNETLSIEKQDIALNSYIGESGGLPHIWAPKTIEVSGSNNGLLVSLKYLLYSSIFMEYNLEDTAGNARAGTIKAVWNQGASVIKITEEATDDIGNTSAYLISFNIESESININLYNNGVETVYCNTTSRILIRPTIQTL